MKNDNTLKLVSSGLPEPSENNPFAQIDYIFRRRGELSNSNKTKGSYIGVGLVFMEYLADCDGSTATPGDFQLSKAFTWDVHFRYYKWMAAQGERFAMMTIVRHLNHLRQTINYARSHKFIRHEIFFVRPKKNALSYQTSERRTAYDSDLFEPIRELLDSQYRAIKQSLHLNKIKVDVNSLDLPGRDPRIVPPHRMTAHLKVLDFLRSHSGSTFTPNKIQSLLGLGAGVGKRACQLWYEYGVIEQHPYYHFNSKKQTGWSYKFKIDPTEAVLRDIDQKTYGWKNIDNVIWYIFNELGGELPEFASDGGVLSTPLDDPATVHYALREITISKLQSVMDERGLPYKKAGRVDAPTVITMAAMLAMVTGLNVESLSDLRSNCVTIEPISGKPCLQYVKIRSKGKKVLTLFDEEDRELYSDSDAITDGTDQLLYFSLLPDACRVQEIIETTLELTKDIRKKAPPEHINRLFIFEDMQRNVAGINPNNIKNSWSTLFRRNLADHIKHKLSRLDLPPEVLIAKKAEIDDEIAKAPINLSKFRGSLATELAMAGAPIEIIQAVLGHRQSSTTKLYLERHRMEVSYHQEVSKALNKLKSGKRQRIIHCEDEGDLAQRISKKPMLEIDSNYIFETGTPLFCRNPYQPSSHIKKDIKSWVDGKSVCHRWNKCLFCDNVVIVDLALPKLIAYHNKLKLDLTDGMDNTPGKRELLIKTIAVIDQIIDPQHGFFDEKIVADARTRANLLTSIEVDHYFYKGVAAWR